MEKQAEEGVKRKLVGIEVDGKAIARHDYPIFHQAEMVGKITSGTWSPTLEHAIALAYVPIEHSKLGMKLLVEIREKKFPVTVVKKAYYRRN